MRKIVVTFSKINKLKKLMKAVYTSGLNDGSKLAKFNLKKTFIPSKVEEVELEIKKLIGANTKLVIPKTSLTFLSAQTPFNIVDNASEIEGSYIILPWNIATNTGKNELKALINQITTSTINIKYTVNINTDQNSNINTNINTNNRGSDIIISNAELSFSENSFEDQTEGLFNKIQELENTIRLLTQNLQNSNSEVIRQQNLVEQKNTEISQLTTQINNLNTQVNNLNNQTSNLNNQISQKQSQINNLNSQVSSLQNTNNAYYNQITQLNNKGNDQAYTMTLTNYTQIPDINSYSLNFGVGGLLTFAKPINLTVN